VPHVEFLRPSEPLGSPGGGATRLSDSVFSGNVPTAGERELAYKRWHRLHARLEQVEFIFAGSWSGQT
jgi:hypothetical protein